MPDLQYTAIITDENRATVELFGAIGGDFNGHQIAKEILYVGQHVDEIELLVNCEGGSVIQGYSIYSAIKKTPANVTAKIEGVAASMAVPVVMACDRVLMANYSRLMIHDPYPAGNPGKKGLNPKQKNASEALRSSLVDILKGRTGKEDVEISALMKDETWFKPEAALNMGLVDEVYQTGKEVQINDELAPEELVKSIAAQIVKNQNPNKMEKVTAKLNLSGEAKEDEIVNAIEGLETAKTEAETKLSDAENSLTEKETEITSLKDQLKEQNRKLAENIVDGYIAAKKIKADKRDDMVDLAVKDMDGFIALMDSVTPGIHKISDHIEGGDGNGEKKDFDWYSKNDPDGLAKMRTAEPEKYKRLEREYEKTL